MIDSSSFAIPRTQVYCESLKLWCAAPNTILEMAESEQVKAGLLSLHSQLCPCIRLALSGCHILVLTDILQSSDPHTPEVTYYSTLIKSTQQREFQTRSEPCQLKLSSLFYMNCGEVMPPSSVLIDLWNFRAM